MMEKQLKQLKKLTNEPEIYLTVQNEKLPKIKNILKGLYDQSRSTSNTGTALPQLILEHMDDEQIWQQLELNNEELVDHSIPSVSKVLSLDERKLELRYKRKNEDVDDEMAEEDEEDDEENEEDENEVDSDEEEIRQRRKEVKKASGKSSIVDDQFFKLSEMEAFLEQEDKKAMGKMKVKDDGINYFDDLETDSEEDEDEKNLKYQDYFAPDGDDDDMQVDDEFVGQEGEGDEEEEDMEDDEDEPTGRTGHKNDQDETEKSTFEKRQDKLKETIERLEEKALAGRSWQLKGEIHAGSRPKDALLEEYLEFDAATRPAPIITQETTMLLEDIIKQRIKDTAFDDVERKVKPTQAPQEYRKTLVLDQEKSKESLAQIYEKEYLKQKAKLDISEEKDDEPETHKAIRKSLTSLFAKLDALSNYHFTPKPAAPDVKIITNTPAIEMEEVAPIAMSNANLLAPEEVKRRARGDVKTTGEMTETDKKRARRQKKAKQRMHSEMHKKRDAANADTNKTANAEKARLLKTVMKSRNVEAMRIEKISKIKSSTDFFHLLNERESIKTTTSKKVKQPKTTGISAKFVKL